MLTLASTHPITCGAAHLIGTAVLVPKATRERIERWNRLHRPPSWPDQDHHHRTPPPSQSPPSQSPPGEPPPGEPGCALCQDTGRVPDS